MPVTFFSCLKHVVSNMLEYCDRYKLDRVESISGMQKVLVCVMPGLAAWSIQPFVTWVGRPTAVFVKHGPKSEVPRLL
jgi:hypothetical protein